MIQSAHASDFEQAVAQATHQALEEYPELADQDSELSKSVKQRLAHLRSVNSALLRETDWPLFLARECAASLNGNNASSTEFSSPIVFRAITRLSGLGDIRSNQGNTKTTVEMGSKAVEIEIRFGSGPVSKYSVDCFFFARNVETGNLWVFDAQTNSSEKRYAKFRFFSGPLTGNTETSKSSTRMFSMKGSTVTEGTVSTSLEKGDKVSGWIVRLRHRDVVYDLKASIKPLEDLDKANQDGLDKILLAYQPNPSVPVSTAATPASGISAPVYLEVKRTTWDWASGGELALHPRGSARHTEWQRDGSWERFSNGTLLLVHPGAP